MLVTIMDIQQYETEMLSEIDRICEKHKIRYWLAYGSALGAVRHNGPIPWDSDADILINWSDYSRLISYLHEELSEKFCVDWNEYTPDYAALFARVSLHDKSYAIIHVDIFPLIKFKNRGKLLTYMFYARLLALKYMIKIKKQKMSSMRPIFYRRAIIAITKIILLPFTQKAIVKRFRRICEKNDANTSNSRIMPCHFTEAMGRVIFDESLFGNGIGVSYDGHIFMVPTKYDEYLTLLYGEYNKLPDEKYRQKMMETKYEIMDR